MPDSSQTRRPTVLSRRAVLAWAAAVSVAGVLAACTSDELPDEHPSRTPPTTPYVDPDADAHTRAVASSASLVSLYEAALRRPDLDEPTAATLGTLFANHRQHLVALGAPAASATTTPIGSVTTTTTAASPTTTSAPPTTPTGTVADTLADLLAAERGASNTTAGDAINATDGGFAQLLASIAACQAVHAAVLRAAGGGDT